MKKQLTKQEIKEKQEKKQRILSLIKKALNIVCYVLSVLFLILCVAVGVQSCNSSKDKTNKLIKRDNNYSLRENNNNLGSLQSGYYFTFNVNQNAIGYVTQNDEDLTWVMNYNNGEYSYTFELDSNKSYPFHFRLNDDIYTIDDLYNSTPYRYLDIYINKNNQGYWYWYGINLITADWQNSITILNATTGVVSDKLFYSASLDDVTITLGSGQHFDGVASDVLKSLINFNYVDTSTSLGNFYFNTQINFNAPYQQSLNLPYVQDASFNVAPYYQQKSANLWFICDGVLYNRIILNYVPLEYNYYFDSDNTIVKNSISMERGYYLYMSYYNTLTDEIFTANYRDIQYNYKDDTQGGLCDLIYNSSHWTNYKAQNIFVLTGQDTFINDLNNNVLSNVGSGTSDIFALLGFAFSSLNRIFSIAILPGITIGVLMFMPLVVLIIITIFRMVKK